MRLSITHTTRYSFEAAVRYGLQQLRKTPKSSYQQKVLNWSTTIDGGHHETQFEDHHNNTVDLISFEKGTQSLSVTCAGEIEIDDASGVLGKHRGPAPLWLYRRATPRTEAKAAANAIVRGVDGDTPLEKLHALSDAISSAILYEVGASEPDWSAEDALAAGRGVCQDHTHVFLACARAMDIPARYVSGYLMLTDRTVQDAMHAWAEAHIDGLGWVGFDISNGISPDARYVRVATGLDYADAAPIAGTRFGGADEALAVEIQVTQQ